MSPLRKAIEKGCLHSVRAALDAGAAINEADVHGAPGLPMRTACFNGHVHIVQEFISRGADIHAPNADGPSGPLRMAVRGKHQDVIDLLLSHGAQVPDDIQLPQSQPGERRRRTDRRHLDQGPPASLRERRNREERRTTSVSELELPENLWGQYFAEIQPTSQAPAAPHHDDTAASILARVRD